MKTNPLGYLLLGVGALLAVAAVAGPPVLPVLNPPAPSYETCKATGDGAICRGPRVDNVDSTPLGIVCGAADNPVELFFSGTDAFDFTRYYDRAGDLTRRVTHEDFQGTVINPVTGLSAEVVQVMNFIDTLVIPGNLDTITTKQTGSIKIFLPGAGMLLLDAGRILFDEQGDIVAQNGRHDLFEYLEGNTAVATQLCAALGSPGTP